MTVTVWLDLWRKTVVVRRQFVPTERSVEARQPSATQRYLAHCQWLDHAVGHPVVRLVDRDRERLSIATLFTGPATAVSRPRQPRESAQLITAVAEAIARLHGGGLVHGNLSGDHILVNGQRFSLCSPATPAPGQQLEPVADVVAFNPLINELLAIWDDTNAGALKASERRRWEDLALIATEPSMSAARLARKARLLQ